MTHLSYQSFMNNYLSWTIFVIPYGVIFLIKIEGFMFSHNSGRKNMTVKATEMLPIRTIFGSLFTLVWLILTLIYYKDVLNAYNTTNLPYALLTVDSLFFAGIIVLIAAVFSVSGTYQSFQPSSIIINVLLDISGALAVLIIANISAYFTTGLLHSMAIYYQIWTLPAAITLFYHVMPFNKIKKDS